MNIIKNRSIPKYDYFEQLQREYVMCIVRSKVYYKPNDKKHWRKVADLKRARIESISIELGVTNIFKDYSEYVKYLNDFKNEGGIPKFVYKENDQEELKKTDLLNYYKEGGQVKCISQNKVGIISLSNEDTIEKGIVFIDIEGLKHMVDLVDIVRLV